MASRRDASSQRTRTISLNPTTRSKPISSMDATSNAAPRPATSLDAPVKPSPAFDSDSIRVFVRCRGRSRKEKDENSPSVVSVDGVKQELVILHAEGSKTYAFDGVFDHKKDQDLVYKDVVSPMLESVLLGYNCTLFAYGQTGTGKTHTMQGNLDPAASGGLRPDAGMIPRVLSNLFSHLQSKFHEYTVQVTFVELYNEEFRDLLNPSLGPPTGSKQPMGKSRQQGKADEVLKIVNDPRRGFTIKGIEPTPVKDVKDAIDLLRSGTQRRQVASTNLNDRSSRSHSIFTITVYTETKDSSPGGTGGRAKEEYFRTGKFNLVDLAGSENIGKSLAEGQQAREAGKINQSLLTLGRVINNLVDPRQGMPPYRDSKLTQLLQDSLGGNTKTCIIATISPAQKNLAETYSTLDYALRAKSIKNRPEVNQRVERDWLVNDLGDRIARLEADLRAARTGEGWYTTKQTWDETTSARDAAEKALRDAREQVDELTVMVDNERALKVDLETVVEARDAELADLREKLENTQLELANTKSRLENVERDLANEKIVVNAYRRTEEHNAQAAQVLTHVAEERLTDNEGLLEKLQRQTSHMEGLVKAFKGGAEGFSRAALALGEEADHCFGAQEGILSDVDGELKRLQGLMTANLAAVELALEEQSKAWSVFERQLEDQDPSLVDLVLPALQGADIALRKTLSENKATCEKQCQSLLAKAQGIRESISRTAKSKITELQNMYQTSMDQIAAHLSSEEELRESIKADVHSLLKSETERASKEDQWLNQLLKLAKERETAMRSFGKTQNKILFTASDAAVKFGEAVGEQLVAAKQVKDRAVREIEAQDESAKTVAANLQGAVGKGLGAQTALVEQSLDGLRETASKDVDNERKAKKAKKGHVQSYSSSLRASYESLRSGVKTHHSSAISTISNVSAKGSNLRQLTRNHQSSIRAQVSTSQTQVEKLKKNTTRPLALTGQTPRKRKWDEIAPWERTKEPASILREHAAREDGRVEEPRQLRSSASSGTGTAVDEPLVSTVASPEPPKTALEVEPVEPVAEDEPVPATPLVIEALPPPTVPVAVTARPATSAPVRAPRLGTLGVPQTSSQGIGRPPSKMGRMLRKPNGKAPLNEINAGRRAR